VDPGVVPRNFANFDRKAPASPAHLLSYRYYSTFPFVRQSGPPLSGSAAVSFWTPASQVKGVTQKIPAGNRVPGEGKSKISGKEDWEGKTQLSEGDTDSDGDHLDWWGAESAGNGG
jgi:hypothetical protein